MIRKGFLSVLCVALFLGGCSSLPGRERVGSVSPRAQAVPRTKVINAERLRKGGKIFVRPFIPGEFVTYDEEFARVSLYVLKGFLTALQQGPDLYTPLGPAEAGQSELVVEGRILEKKTRRVFEKLWKRKTVYILKTEGSVVDRDDKTVMYFTHELRRDDVDGFNDLAEEVGHDIGRSVLISSR